MVLFNLDETQSHILAMSPTVAEKRWSVFYESLKGMNHSIGEKLIKNTQGAGMRS